MENKLAVQIVDTFNSPFGRTNDLADLVNLFIQGSIALASILALVIIIIAGYQIMSSSSSSNPKGAATGKEALTWAIIGFIVIVFAYTILQGIKLTLGL